MVYDIKYVKFLGSLKREYDERKNIVKHFGNISAAALGTMKNLYNHSCNISYIQNICRGRGKKSDLIEKGLRL